MPEEMAFARHNIEKRRLIELVRLNPILWDCRLPHYKRSDKKKAIKWNELGRIFNVNGERVQRTFTSLREIFRRELNHEKLLGNRFKSKWEYYDSMAFLREVIRERKSRERTKSSVILQMPQQQQEQAAQQHQHNNNNNNINDIDEYQYFAPNDPNNPINQAQNSNQQNMQTINTTTMQPPHESNQLKQQQQQQQLQTLKLQSDVILNLNSNALNTLQNLSANGTPPLPTISNTHSGSTSPSIYIKDEPDSPDETISLTSTQNDKDCNVSGMPHNVHNKVSKHYNNNASNGTKFGTMQPNTNINIKKKAFRSSNIDENMPDHDLDVDDDPDVDMLDDMDEGRFSTVSTMTMTKHRPSAREILYTKFGDFLAARLNTLQETLANELMNKILLLIAEK